MNFNVGHFSAKYQGYSLTFWPKIPQVHHFSIYNQNQLISMLFISQENSKAIALLFGQKSLIFITFQFIIKINEFQNVGYLSANYQGYSLTFRREANNFITFQCVIKINEFQCWSFVSKLPRV